MNPVKGFISRLRFSSTGIPDIAAYFFFSLYFRSQCGPYFSGKDSRKGIFEIAFSGSPPTGIVLHMSIYGIAEEADMCMLKPMLDDTYSFSWWTALYFDAGTS